MKKIDINQHLGHISYKLAHIKSTGNLLAFILLFGVMLFSRSIPAYAAAPGCYSKNTSAGTGQITYTRTDCPSSVKDTSKCWFAVPSRSGAASYTQIDCASITEAASPTNSTPSTNTSGGSSSINPLDGVSVTPVSLSKNEAKNTCGSGGTDSDPHGNEVKVAFDFGCLGPAYGKPLNPIIDIAFALFRFLSAGVGLIVIGSIIVAGIQYSSSRGDPQATMGALKRISNSIMALLLFIFIFAIANFLVPGGMFL